jgi:hypothetical protein
VTYHVAKKKMPEAFVENFGQTIPGAILQNRTLSVLENIVAYLKENKQFSLTEIAKLLHRNSQTIWTVYSRVQKKRGRA